MKTKDITEGKTYADRHGGLRRVLRVYGRGRSRQVVWAARDDPRGDRPKYSKIARFAAWANKEA